MHCAQSYLLITLHTFRCIKMPDITEIEYFDEFRPQARLPFPVSSERASSFCSSRQVDVSYKHRQLILYYDLYHNPE